MSNAIDVYTDGGCRGNPGIGGWGFAIYSEGHYRGKKSGGKVHTTNNEMELTALLEVLKWLNNFPNLSCLEIHIYTDSSYVLQGYTNWVTGWHRKGWRTASGTPVKNLELWKQIHKLKVKLDRKGLSVRKVKAHAGIPGNERADSLCNIEMDKLEKNND